MADWNSFLQGLSKAYGPMMGKLGSTMSPGQPVQGGSEEDLPSPEPSGDAGPYSTKGISEMIDLKKLGLLFDQAKTDPDARKAIRALGPGFSAEQAGPKKESILGGFELPEARKVGPQGPMEGDQTGEKFNISGVDEAPKGPDWGRIGAIANIGFTDLAKAISDHPEGYGGAMYELNKGKLQQEQIQKLRARQSMWEESYKTSQSIPAEVLNEPEYAELAQAKQALDKDAADGAIDNEKNVTNFNMALTRARHGILSKQQEQEDQLKLSSLSRLNTGAQEQQLGQRQRLEALASDPTSPLARAAQAELEKLKLSDVQTRDIGGQQVSQTGEAWGGYDLKRPDVLADRALREKQMGLQYSYRNDALRDRDAARSSAALGSMLESSMRRYSKVDPMTGEAANPEEALEAGLVENEDAIIQAARGTGIEFQSPEETGGSYVVNGRTFNAADPRQTAAALKLLYQMTRTR